MFTDYCLALLDISPRRYKVIVNLLNGRRTISTLFWGQQYNLLRYYNALHQLSLNRVEISLLELQKKGLVDLDQPNGLVWLTRTGQQRQKQVLTNLYQPQYLNVCQYLNLHQVIPILRLALQVVSQAVHEESHYYPVNNNLIIQQTVKRWYRRAKIKPLASSIYQVLQTQLAQLEPVAAELFVADLTGFQHPGLTQQQLATRFSLTSSTVALHLLDSWAQLIQILLKSDDSWTQLILPFTRPTRLSNSCQQSYRAFLNGQSLAQIAVNRHVKPNTVKEHLLEAAILESDFPFNKFLTPELLQQLTMLYQGPMSEWNFQKIVDQHLSVDFFHFRLYQIARGAEHDGLN